MVIGAGSVVTRNIPKYAVIGGNPASVIKYRDQDAFEKLKKKINLIDLLANVFAGFNSVDSK